MVRAYHKELEYLHVNCEKPRAYYIPYENNEKALLGNRYDSEYYFDLNGNWNFNFYKSFEDVDDDFLSKSFENTIPVPKCWQTELNKGYDVPLYSNLWYPFPIDPPYVPVDNPTGHYNRTINIKKKEGKKYFINFEGVSSCFYLYINKEFVGYSQVSHCTSEFEITDKLLNGENRIDVLVVKWCDGSYLEDQDMFRLSGIFRDTYILERDENCLTDVFIHTSLDDDFNNAKVIIEADTDFEYSFYDADGSLISEGKSSNFEIKKTILWNSENPYSYILIIKKNNEYIPFRVSFKKLEFKGNVAYFNDKPIKLLGINRHDSNPKTGYYTSLEDMKEDLFILKRANVNTIRTSHYPNSPLFMELCEQYGFMIVDEADIETHGMGFEYKDTWDWFRWSKLSTDDEWEASYVDRAERFFERDKNFGNVIMWSLGNESGSGKNHRAMRNYIKSRDNNAIVHYENSHLEFKAVPVGENFSDISDVESRMYSSLEYTEEYAKSKWAKKPFFFCEYCCSMSTGDIHAHVDLIRKYPTIFGGCFWELTDHAVEIGEGKYRYGGDFGDFPNNDICCVDGVVFPDRKPRPGFYDLKKAYEPVCCEYNNGVLSIFNRNYFKAFDNCTMTASLKINGETINSFVFENVSIEPRTQREYKLNFVIPDSDCAFIDVTFNLKEELYWAEKGYEIAFAQFDVSSNKTVVKNIVSVLPELNETSRYINIKCGNTEYIFDKPYGRIDKIIVGGDNILSSPVSVELWKAPGNNELGRAEECKSAAMESAIMNVRNSKAFVYSDRLEIITEVSVGGPAVVPVLSGKVKYFFYGDGNCDIYFNGETRELLEKMNLRLPRFGFRFVLNKGFQKFTYFGKGPGEAYPERHKAQRYGRFTDTVDNSFVPYVFPMENGAHFGTRNAEITDEKNTISFVPLTDDSFIFNASKYDPVTLEKCKHNDELPESENTYVYLDYRMDIRGGRGIYEITEPERKWDFGHFEFGVRIKPFNN